MRGLVVCFLSSMLLSCLCAAPSAQAQGFEEAQLMPFVDSEGSDLLNDPHSLTVDRSGTVFVINENGVYNIVELPAGGAPRRLPELGAFGFTDTITSDAHGDLFVGGEAGPEGLIQEIPPGGSPETLPATGLKVVEGIAVDEAGDLFAVGTGIRGVVELTTDGERRVLPILGLAPHAVAINPAGNLVVGDQSTISPNPPQVEEVPLEGEPRIVIPFFSEENEITTIAFDPKGDMFICLLGARNVFEMLAGAEGPSELTLTAPDHLAVEGEAIGLAFDDVGNLYISYLGSGEPAGTEYGYVLEARVASGHELGPAPAVTAVTPVYGREAGGTSVNITGEHLFQITEVRFGSTPATSFSVNSETSITAQAPAGTGTVDITVTAPPGTSEITPADNFTFVPTGPAPAISNISAKTGPTAGGTSVTITGTGFIGVTSVQFGATQATSFAVNSSTSITAGAPAGTSGPVYISVTTPNGATKANSHDLFRYGQPTITNISPNTGPIEGGTAVTITGTGFAPGTNGTAILFGKNPAVSVNCASITSCVAVAPGVDKGTTADVQAAVGTSTSQKVAADQFTYYESAAIVRVSPSRGLAAGGTSVTITGKGFSSVTGVKFGSTNATSYKVNSATSITAVSPASSAGIVDIMITTANGTSETTAADLYMFEATTVTKVSPTKGAVAGGTSVTITGTGFTGATAVKFGSTNATSYKVNSATSITAVSPASSAGIVDIMITTANGTSETTAADHYTYH
jgi:IPT/TIG domain